MLFYWLLLMLGLFVLIWYIYEKCKGFSVKETILKSTVSAIFMIVATVTLFQFSKHGSSLTMPYFLIAGCLFGLLGDIWLDLKFVHREDETLYTFAGFCEFGIMHITVIVGLIVNYAVISRVLYIIIPLILGMIIGAINVSLDKIMKLDYGKYKFISGVYGGILISTTLLIASLAIMNSLHNSALNLAFVGYVLFLASDLVLSQTYFAGKGENPYIIANYATYYPAMFILASVGLLIY